MASLDSLPPDQRAVLQLVLQRGRSYDDIAKLLSIDRTAVRDRALQAFDALGPQTRVPDDRRALITDYLLAQLPPLVADDVHTRLGESASERAWARVVASELQPLASSPLPDIPADASAGGGQARESAAPRDRSEPRVAEPIAAAGADDTAERPTRQRSAREQATRERGREREGITAGLGLGGRREGGDGLPRSRTGGAVLLGLGVAVVVAVVVILIATSGGGSNKPKHASVATTTPTTTAGSTTGTGTGTTTGSAKVIAQVNLRPPGSASAATKSPAGVAEVLQSGASTGIALLAQNMPANTKHNAYAVWLYNSGSDSRLLGFVSPGVGSNGKLSTEGPLPTDASHFRELVVTLETQAKPKTPGQIVLIGTPQTGQTL
jgi:hypothetical protein